MAKIKKVKWFTSDKMNLISEDNKLKYDKYIKSCTIKNTETINTTYKSYRSNFYQFMCFLAVNYNNIGLYSKEFMTNAVDIMEDYISFCQNVLLNHKKTINNKIAAISSFYIWALKRGCIETHPFDKKLDRMKGAGEEKIINSYFLTEEQVVNIRKELKENDRFDIQDQILFEIAYSSANRIGALEKLTLSSLDLENMMFTDIREKEGYHVEVVFESYAAELLKTWIKERETGFDFLKVDSPLITYYDKLYHPMNREAIHNRMRKYGKIVGIDDFRAHCCRKSRLNNIYDETGDLSLAAELANHKSIETTRQFYTKPKSKAEVRDKIKALEKSENIK